MNSKYRVLATRDVVDKHALCGHGSCPNCESLIQTGAYITKHGLHNGVRLPIRSAGMTAVTRHVELEGEIHGTRVRGVRSSTQYTYWWDVAGRRFTKSTIEYPNYTEMWDELHEEYRGTIRVDGVYLTTYLDALQETPRESRGHLGAYGITAWAIAKYLLVNDMELVTV